MPRTCEFDQEALARVLRKQHGVLSYAQALDCGMTGRAVRYRGRKPGPWQLLLPGVYLTHTGKPTDEERDMAALLYAGAQSVLTGAAALRRHGLEACRRDTVDVLVPLNTQRQDAAFVRLHRTARLPTWCCVAGQVRFAFPERAVADAARGLTRLSDVRAVVAEAVQRGRCPLPLLAEELADGPVRGSARLRRALAEVSLGIRSPAEGDLHDLIVWARLPMPMFNPRLLVGEEFLAKPDCWWPEPGVAAEADSRRWHLSPADWEYTMTRHARMSAQGIIVLHFSPAQIRTERSYVADVIHKALAAGAGRSLPHIRAI